MCEAGVNIKAMQEILGHADAETTMDTYAEATKELIKSELINFEEFFERNSKHSKEQLIVWYNMSCDQYATDLRLLM